VSEGGIVRESNRRLPSFSGLAFERRAFAEGYRLPALAADDPVLRKVYDALAVAYDRLAGDLDRAAEAKKRIEARTKTTRTAPPQPRPPDR
jgi:hypothetical protein